MMMVSNDAKNDKPTMSKRQRRKLGANPSNTWPQQPKIKSEAARNRAYLANAGFTPNNNSLTTRGQKRKSPLDPELDVINSPEFKFGRLLASPDALTRHATILKLQAYLKARCAPFTSTTTTAIDTADGNGEMKKRRRRNDDDPGKRNDDDINETQDNVSQFRGLSELDLLKLWKGLWHTLYLCDGVSVQTEVSKVLAKLMWSVAGSEEQDEYAGRLYLEIDDEDRSVEGVEEDAVGTKDDEVTEEKVIEEDDATKETGSNFDAKDDSSASSDNESLDDSNTKHCRGAHLSQLFIRTYFKTLNREWYKMDKYRIDKFYTLTRLVLRESYRYMAARHWNLGIIRLFNDALFEEVLRPTSIGGVSGGVGNGVRFHILDICLEELSLVNAEEATGLKLTEASLLDCLEPFFEMLVKVQDKILHDRVLEKVVHRFLIDYSVVSDNYDNSSNDEDVNPNDDEEGEEMMSKRKLVMSEVHVGSVAQFIFELASDSKTLDRYRKALYDMHKTFVKRIKEVGRDVSLSENVDEESYDICDEGVEEKDSMNLTEEDHMVEVVKKNIEVNEETASKGTPKGKSKNKKQKKKKSKVKQNEIGEECVRQGEDEETDEKMSISPMKDINNDEDKKALDDEEAAEKITLSSLKENKSEEGETDKDTPSKKRKKRKKKNKAKELEEELSITISVDEQKEAIKAATEAKEAEFEEIATARKKKDEGTSSDAIMATPKKVKFTKMNKSKSYKASMKDLKKIDHKAERTPEKSILMKKLRAESDMNDKPSSSKKSSASKKKRKKSKTSR